MSSILGPVPKSNQLQDGVYAVKGNFANKAGCKKNEALIFGVLDGEVAAQTCGHRTGVPEFYSDKSLSATYKGVTMGPALNKNSAIFLEMKNGKLTSAEKNNRSNY